MQCPHCSQEHPDEINFCPITGNRLLPIIFCKNCGTKLEEDWSICPNCGSLISKSDKIDLSDELNKSSKQTIILIKAKYWKKAMYAVPLFITILVISGVIFLALLRVSDSAPRDLDETGSPEDIPTQESITYTPSPEPTGTSQPIMTFAPLLYDEEFPDETIEYPQNWSVDLVYPPSFQVIGAVSGSPPGETVLGWEAKLRYSGTMQEAVNSLTEFFNDRGWQIEDSLEAGESGLILFLEKDNRRNIGTLTLSPSTQIPDTINIVAIIFQ
jgi:hypothetical protein